MSRPPAAEVTVAGPLANNVLTGALALTRDPFLRILLPLFLGNVTFPPGVAYLSSMGIELFN